MVALPHHIFWGILAKTFHGQWFQSIRIALDDQDDENNDDNIEKHLTSIGLLYWLTSIPSLQLICWLLWSHLTRSRLWLSTFSSSCWKWWRWCLLYLPQVVKLSGCGRWPRPWCCEEFLLFFYCLDHCDDQDWLQDHHQNHFQNHQAEENGQDRGAKKNFYFFYFVD